MPAKKRKAETTKKVVAKRTTKKPKKAPAKKATAKKATTKKSTQSEVDQLKKQVLELTKALKQQSKEIEIVKKAATPKKVTEKKDAAAKTTKAAKKEAVSKKSTKAVEAKPKKVKVQKPIEESKFTLQQKAAFAAAPSGQVLSFGSGDMSQLGLGTEENMRERKKPTVLPLLKDIPIKQISAGSLHNCVLTADGEVYTWGCNDDSALGRICDEKDDEDEWTPKKLDIGDHIIKVCSGASHCIALSAAGECYTWGTYRDSSGVMGHSSSVDRQTIPAKTEILSNVVDVACGDEINLALTASGKVYQWGDLQYGQRTSDRLKFARLKPRQVPFPRHVKPVKIFAGGYTAFVADASGAMWVWGPNNYGQCGVAVEEEEDEEDRELWVQVPTLVDLPKGEVVTDVAANLHHTILCTASGKAYCMGRGSSGRMGTGNEDDQRTPCEVTALAAHKIAAVATGDVHCMAVSSAGDLFTWGDGTLLQLGNGEEDDVLTPYHVKAKELQTAGRKVLAASGGSQHSLILATAATTSTASSTAPSTAPTAEPALPESDDEPELPADSDEELPPATEAPPVPAAAAEVMAEPELPPDSDEDLPEPELPADSDDDN